MEVLFLLFIFFFFPERTCILDSFQVNGNGTDMLTGKRPLLQETKVDKSRIFCIRQDSFYWELWAQTVKSPPAVQETWIPSLVRKIPGRGHAKPLQYSCLENSHGQRSLVGCGVVRPWSWKVLDSNEQLCIAKFLR